MGIFIFRAHKGTRIVSILDRNYSRGQKVQMVAWLRSQLQPSALQFQSLANLKMFVGMSIVVGLSGGVMPPEKRLAPALPVSLSLLKPPARMSLPRPPVRVSLPLSVTPIQKEISLSNVFQFISGKIH